MITENIEHMMKNLVDGDKNSAMDQISYILTQKVSEKLEDMKTTIGHNFFNGVQSDASGE